MQMNDLNKPIYNKNKMVECVFNNNMKFEVIGNEMQLNHRLRKFLHPKNITGWDE